MLSTLAMKGVLDAAAPELRAQFHATQALLKSIAEGASADVVILTAGGIDELARQGKVAASSRVELGSCGVGIAVKQGAARPDIRTVEALKAALLAAGSVAHSQMGASGIYFAQLLERLGIADRLKKRVIVEKGPVGAAVARGEAELGAQLLCELTPVPGIEIAGPLPEEVQSWSVFAAAVMAGSARRAAAQAFLDFLGTAPVQAAMRNNQFIPAPRSPRRPG